MIIVVLTIFKGDSDILNGINKLEDLLKVSCYQKYKNQ